MRGRLNLFQCAMLQWRSLHPYCAAHVIRIPASLDAARLESRIARALETLGLTGYVLDAAARRFDWRGGPARVAVPVLEGGGSPLERAAAEIESLINRPFPESGPIEPFRFFAVRESDDAFLLGLVYDHVVAGGDSIVVLMTDLSDRYLAEREDDVPLPRLERYPSTYVALLARHWPRLLSALLSLPAQLAGWRRARRPGIKDPADGHNGFTHFAVPPEGYARLRAAAKGFGVTVNELLFAIVLKAVAPLWGGPRPGARRNEVAVASIINVRGDYQGPATEVFGPFLASMRVLHPVPAGTTIAELTAAVHAQTARAKRRRLHYLTLAGLAVAGLMWRYSGRERRQRLYLKYHPAFAGMTPLNVNYLRRRGTSADGDYLRCASTGPMSAMVISVTTSGEGMRVGITYRRAALSRSAMDGVAGELLQQIEQL
jgi:NRPS condensation-like uncharacterized protein